MAPSEFRSSSRAGSRTMSMKSKGGRNEMEDIQRRDGMGASMQRVEGKRT